MLVSMICMAMHIDLGDTKILSLIGLYTTIGDSVITILYCTCIEKRSLASMGLVKKRVLSHYLIGLAKVDPSAYISGLGAKGFPILSM